MLLNGGGVFGGNRCVEFVIVAIENTLYFVLFKF